MTTPSIAMARYDDLIVATTALEHALDAHGVPEADAPQWEGLIDHLSHGFSCARMDQAKSNHAAIALRPTFSAAVSAWRAFADAAVACSPVLRSLDVGLAYDPFQRLTGTSEQMFQYNIEMAIHDQASSFSSAESFKAALHTYLCDTQGIPVGTGRFTITATRPPVPGGLESTRECTYTAASAEDAVLLWNAEMALKNTKMPIISIVQTHDHASVVAAAAQRRASRTAV